MIGGKMIGHRPISTSQHHPGAQRRQLRTGAIEAEQGQRGHGGRKPGKGMNLATSPQNECENRRRRPSRGLAHTPGTPIFALFRWTSERAASIRCPDGGSGQGSFASFLKGPLPPSGHRIERGTIDLQSDINCLPERSLLGAFGKQHDDYDHDVFNSAGSTLATPHFGPENGVHLTRHRRQHRHFHTRQRDRPAPVANRRTIQGRRHLRRRSRWKQLYRVFLSRFHGLPRPQRGVDRAGRVDWPDREAGGQKRRRIRDRAIRIGQLFRLALGTTRSRARVSAGRRATGRCAYRRDREPRLLATPGGRGPVVPRIDDSLERNRVHYHRHYSGRISGNVHWIPYGDLGSIHDRGVDPAEFRSVRSCAPGLRAHRAASTERIRIPGTGGLRRPGHRARVRAPSREARTRGRSRAYDRRRPLDAGWCDWVPRHIDGHYRTRSANHLLERWQYVARAWRRATERDGHSRCHGRKTRPSRSPTAHRSAPLVHSWRARRRPRRRASREGTASSELLRVAPRLPPRPRLARARVWQSLRSARLCSPGSFRPERRFDKIRLAHCAWEETRTRARRVDCAARSW